MAKKTKNDIDDEWGDLWDDDEFSLDSEGGFDPYGEPKARGPVSQVTGSFIEGVKSSFFRRETAIESVRKNLPKSYASALEGAWDTKDDLEDTASEAAREAGKAVNQFKNDTKDALNDIAGLLPGKAGDKLRNWANKTDTSNKFSDGKNQDELAISSALAGVFGQKVQTEQAVKQTELSMETKAEAQKQTALTLDTNKLLFGMSKDISNLASYQDNIGVNFQRKTLEIQMQHMFISRKHLDLAQKQAEFVTESLKSIVHNTALPDLVKTQTNELVKDQLKKQFISEVGGPIFRSFGAQRTRIFNHIKKQVVGAVKDLGVMASDGGQTLNGFMMDDGSGDSSVASMVGSMLGQKATEKASEYVSTLIANKLKEDPEFQGRIDQGDLLLRVMKGRGAGYINDKLLRGRTGHRIIDTAASFLNLSELTESRRNTIMTSMANGDHLDKVQVFDLRTKRTITDVIPMLLSRIHLEVHKTNGGKMKSPLKYDWKLQGFSTEKALTNRLMDEGVTTKDRALRTKKIQDTTLSKIDPDDKLSPAARAHISRATTIAGIQGKDISLLDFIKEGSPYYNKKVGKEIAKFAESEWGINLEEVKNTDLDNLTNLVKFYSKSSTKFLEAEEQFSDGRNSLARAFDDPLKALTKAAADGDISDISKFEFIKVSPDGTYTMDYEKYYDYQIKKHKKILKEEEKKRKEAKSSSSSSNNSSSGSDGSGGGGSRLDTSPIINNSVLNSLASTLGIRVNGAGGNNDTSESTGDNVATVNPVSTGNTTINGAMFTPVAGMHPSAPFISSSLQGGNNAASEDNSSGNANLSGRLNNLLNYGRNIKQSVSGAGSIQAATKLNGKLFSHAVSKISPFMPGLNPRIRNRAIVDHTNTLKTVGKLDPAGDTLLTTNAWLSTINQTLIGNNNKIELISILNQLKALTQGLGGDGSSVEIPTPDDIINDSGDGKGPGKWAKKLGALKGKVSNAKARIGNIKLPAMPGMLENSRTRNALNAAIASAQSGKGNLEEQVKKMWDSADAKGRAQLAQLSADISQNENLAELQRLIREQVDGVKAKFNDKDGDGNRDGSVEDVQAKRDEGKDDKDSDNDSNQSDKSEDNKKDNKDKDKKAFDFKGAVFDIIKSNPVKFGLFTAGLMAMSSAQAGQVDAHGNMTLTNGMKVNMNDPRLDKNSPQYDEDFANAVEENKPGFFRRNIANPVMNKLGEWAANGSYGKLALGAAGAAGVGLVGGTLATRAAWAGTKWGANAAWNATKWAGGKFINVNKWAGKKVMQAGLKVGGAALNGTLKVATGQVGKAALKRAAIGAGARMLGAALVGGPVGLAIGAAWLAWDLYKGYKEIKFAGKVGKYPVLTLRMASYGYDIKIEDGQLADNSYINRLRKIEKMLEPFLVVNSDNTVTLTDDFDEDKVKGLFDVLPGESVYTENWEKYFYGRFLPVFATFQTVNKVATGGYDLDKLDAASISTRIRVAKTTFIKPINGKSVYDITRGGFLGSGKLLDEGDVEDIYEDTLKYLVEEQKNPGTSANETPPPIQENDNVSTKSATPPRPKAVDNGIVSNSKNPVQAPEKQAAQQPPAALHSTPNSNVRPLDILFGSNTRRPDFIPAEQGGYVVNRDGGVSPPDNGKVGDSNAGIISGNDGVAGRAEGRNKVILTRQDMIDIAKVTWTEVGPAYKDKEKQKGGKAIIDTILNRMVTPGRGGGYKWGGTVRGVVNAKSQFSAISGNTRAYGSVEKMPNNVVHKELYDFVHNYLIARSNGTPSIIGGHTAFFNADLDNPKYVKDRRILEGVAKAKDPKTGWARHWRTWLYFGEIPNRHYHGTAWGEQPEPELIVEYSGKLTAAETSATRMGSAMASSLVEQSSAGMVSTVRDSNGSEYNGPMSRNQQSYRDSMTSKFNSVIGAAARGASSMLGGLFGRDTIVGKLLGLKDRTGGPSGNGMAPSGGGQGGGTPSGDGTIPVDNGPVGNASAGGYDSNSGPAGRAQGDNTVILTHQDMIDIAKVTWTEVGPAYKTPEKQKGGKAVIDTILNRMVLRSKGGYKWGGTVRGVVNARWQFSAICGPSWAYGSVQRMPNSKVHKELYDFVHNYLIARSNGTPSIVGGHIAFLNPHYSSKKATNGWAKDWPTWIKFGEGKAVHYHGTPRGEKQAPPLIVKYNGRGGVASTSASTSKSVASTQSPSNTTSTPGKNSVLKTTSTTTPSTDKKTTATKTSSSTKVSGGAKARSAPKAKKGSLASSLTSSSTSNVGSDSGITAKSSNLTSNLANNLAAKPTSGKPSAGGSWKNIKTNSTRPTSWSSDSSTTAVPGVGFCSTFALKCGYVHFKFKEYTGSFVNVDGKQLHPHAAAAVNDMKIQAKKDGANLVVVSGFRGIQRQSELTKSGFKERGARVYYTRSHPGFSEHHTGCAIDFNRTDDGFASTKEYAWLEKNAHKFGFVRTYTANYSREYSVSNESWHWKFIGTNEAYRLCIPEGGSRPIGDTVKVNLAKNPTSISVAKIDTPIKQFADNNGLKQSLTNSSNSGDTKTSSGGGSTTHNGNYDPNGKAVKAAIFVTKHAHEKSIGRCALYVRRGFQHAGYKFTQQYYASLYHTNGTMKSMGWVQISNDEPIWVGDVRISTYKPWGHICIFNGKKWVSDFVQPYPDGTVRRGTWSGVVTYRDPNGGGGTGSFSTSEGDAVNTGDGGVGIGGSGVEGEPTVQRVAYSTKAINTFGGKHGTVDFSNDKWGLFKSSGKTLKSFLRGGSSATEKEVKDKAVTEAKKDIDLAKDAGTIVTDNTSIDNVPTQLPDTGSDNSSSSILKGVNDPKGKAVLAAEYATKNAAKKKTKNTTKYVRIALEKGGYVFTKQPKAHMYADNRILSDLGFVGISNEEKSWTGDIKVFYKTKALPNGHICIFNGESWVSDIIQNTQNPPEIKRVKDLPHSTYRDPNGGGGPGVFVDITGQEHKVEPKQNLATVKGASIPKVSTNVPNPVSTPSTTGKELPKKEAFPDELLNGPSPVVNGIMGIFKQIHDTKQNPELGNESKDKPITKFEDLFGIDKGNISNTDILRNSLNIASSNIATNTTSSIFGGESSKVATPVQRLTPLQTLAQSIGQVEKQIVVREQVSQEQNQNAVSLLQSQLNVQTNILEELRAFRSDMNRISQVPMSKSSGTKKEVKTNVKENKPNPTKTAPKDVLEPVSLRK